MTTLPAELQLPKPRVATHPAGDAASSIDQATWWQSAMPTPGSIYIRKGSSLLMTLRYPGTVLATERFRAHLSNDQFDPHFPIIESPARHPHYGCLDLLELHRPSGGTRLPNNLVILT
jgi:hypothetical protein